jgi:hypothetical protein
MYIICLISFSHETPSGRFSGESFHPGAKNELRDCPHALYFVNNYTCFLCVLFYLRNSKGVSTACADTSYLSLNAKYEVSSFLITVFFAFAAFIVKQSTT